MYIGELGDVLLKNLWAALSAGILFTAVFAAGAYGVLSFSRNVSSIGVVYSSTSPTPTENPAINLGVYKDSACTQTATAIDWGTLAPGSTATYTLYVKNTGNARETLSLSTTDWSPSAAAQYITVTWNQNGASLNKNDVVQATLTLTVSLSIDSSITSFSNSIIITGTA
jgi:uncharacterized repeat protein (TIGR01451 family)